nr:10198_t:CDS:2 [Entrophospora candida]CAG8504580.1 11123_t:CDS:2 [Entrophospora candida]
MDPKKRSYLDPSKKKDLIELFERYISPRLQKLRDKEIEKFREEEKAGKPKSIISDFMQAANSDEPSFQKVISYTFSTEKYYEVQRYCWIGEKRTRERYVIRRPTTKVLNQMENLKSKRFLLYLSFVLFIAGVLIFKLFSINHWILNLFAI